MAKSKNTLEFLGMASSDVTGSSYLINWAGKKILIECGMHQTNNLEKDWLVNSRQFKFKPKELEYVYLQHLHADHIALIPRLVAEGFKGTIIVPKGSIEIAKIMFEDSAHIISKDCEYLNKCYGKKYKPMFTKDDVEATLNRMVEFDFGKVHKLDENISFTFYPSQHIISASQLLLTLKDGNKTKRIAYTSDLGNTAYGGSLYCDNFVPISNANIVIGETTYSSKEKSVSSKKSREKDMEKIKSVVNQFVIDNKRKVLIPCFALHRTPVMLTYIYELFKDSKEDFDVVVDSPMAVKLLKVYLDLLKGKDKKMLEKAMSWDRLHLVEDFDSSRACIQTERPMIVLSASGMLNAGRSVGHLKSIIEDDKSCVLICGFANPSTVAGLIKEGKQKVLKIGNEEFKNKVQIVSLISMSSHMQHSELISYYSSIDCNSIYLVHGNGSRYDFAQELQDKYSEECKTTRVFIGERDYVLDL